MDFLEMQINNSGRKSKGRRYTLEQKSLSLAIYKQGPKGYRFLKRIFCLPCKQTILRHSAKLYFETGVDEQMMNLVKDKVKDLADIDKYCILSWDEVSLQSHLAYSHSKNFIEGFIDLDYMRWSSFATHSLTFMVRGLNLPFKHTVGYFYMTTSHQLS